MPERTGVGRAIGDCLTIKAVTLRALRFDGRSRRAFSRHRLRQELAERLRGGFDAAGAFGSDIFTEGSGLRLGGFHSATPLRCWRKSAAWTEGQSYKTLLEPGRQIQGTNLRRLQFVRVRAETWSLGRICR